MLDPIALNTFLAVADAGSFSDAAKRLSITQSAVSQIIKGLEDHLKLKLFDRNGRNIELTEAGMVLIPMAREAITNNLRLEQTMLSLQNEVIGDIRIGCTTSTGKYVIPRQVSLFKTKFPKVTINILVTSRRSMFNQIMSGDVSIGVTSKIMEHNYLEYAHFFSDEIILIVPANHKWAKYGQIYPDDLLDEPILLREETSGTRDVLFNALIQRDISPDMLKVAMVIGNSEAIEMAVEEGLGVAFVSRLSADRGIQLGKIAEVRVEGFHLFKELFLLRNRRNPLSLAQAQLWDHLTRETKKPDSSSFPTL